MLHLHRIANCVNIGNRGFHPVIDKDAALHTKRQSSFFGQGRFRADTDGQYDHIRMERCIVLQQYINSVSVFFKSFYRISQRQLYAVFSDFRVDERSHVGIKGIHQLLGALDNRHIHAQFPEIFRHFQSNKAAAYHNGRFRLVLNDKILDPESILHSAEDKEFLALQTGQVGPHRLCAGSKKQLIIAFLKCFAGLQVLDRYGLFVGMDGGYLVVNLHVDTESGKETLRGLKGKIFRIFDDTANIIRKTAVGIGNKA